MAAWTSGYPQGDDLPLSAMSERPGISSLAGMQFVSMVTSKGATSALDRRLESDLV